MIYKWKRFHFEKRSKFHFETRFHFENVFILKTFLFWKRFRFKKNFTFVSETLSLFFEKFFVLQKEYIKSISKTNRIRFCGRGPCVPPCVEGQCFHVRRLALQILLCRCLTPAGSSRSHCKYVQSSRKSFVVVVTYPWRNVFVEFMT